MSAPFPFPDTDWEPTRPFWEGAARQELRIPRCQACGRWNWYPPECCAGCESGHLRWETVSGRGTLFSYALVERAWVPPFDRAAPYVAALVALEEDPAVRLVSFLVDRPAELCVDMPVRAVFRPLPIPDAPPELLAPLFVPAATAGG